MIHFRLWHLPKIAPVRRGYAILGIVAVLVLTLALTHALWLPSIFAYLDVSEPPRLADVIVVLGGGGGQRERFAARLYEQGYAPLILVSGYTDKMQYALNILAENGVPEDRLLINDEATSTYTEAQQVLDLLMEIDAQSALIATDAFHTRRARATYERVFGEHNIEITLVSPDPGIEPTTWWNSVYRDFVVTEYAKMLYYWAVYGVWSG